MELNNLNGEHTKRSRKRSSLVGNYSKFAIPDSLISDRLINSFSEREREKEKSDQAFSICMKFHFRFPGSFHRAPLLARPDPAIPVRISMLLGGCLLRVNHHLRRQRLVHGWESRTEAGRQQGQREDAEGLRYRAIGIRFARSTLRKLG